MPMGERTGPRPLPVHLMASSGFYMSSIAASLVLNSGSMSWKPALMPEAQAILNLLRSRAQKNPDQSGHGQENRTDASFNLAVEAEARRRVGLMLQGIETYRKHPYRRVVSEPTLAWSEGTTRLHDYRPFRSGPNTKGPVVLVPSLVNRAYILDLQQDHSFARWLSQKGHSVFMVDWDAPGDIEREYTLSDYIARLRRAIGVVTAECGMPVASIGYCMGGLLALAAAQGIPEQVDTLVFMATPWDFHADRPDQATALASLLPGLEPGMAVAGEMAVDVLQTFFMALDPMLGLKKFGALAQWDPESDRAKSFVALEDWLNDGVPLSAPVARECIGRWYGRNDPGLGHWRVDGLPVLPENWTKPALALIPAEDRIVPPKSALALADGIERCHVISPAAGHIGMVAAKSSVGRVWEPLAAFLANPTQK